MRGTHEGVGHSNPPGNKKCPHPVSIIRGHSLWLPSYLPEFPSVGIGTMARGFTAPGCRGFIGPVPPPLWIEAPQGRIELLGDIIIRWKIRKGIEIPSSLFCYNLLSIRTGGEIMADNYLLKMLGNGENVIFSTRQHWFILLKNIFVEGVAILSVIILFTFLALYFAPVERQTSWSSFLPLGYLFVIPPVISLLLDFLQWYNRKFVVTNWRVIQISGVINKDVIDSSLEKVNDVKLSQSFFGRIFNFGTVEILTASELGVNEFKTIGGPVHFKTTIINSKEQLEREGSRPMMSPKAAPGAGVPGTIAQMEELRKQGVLSDDEFKRIKDSLISKL
jgi:hypothetical protein